MEPDPEGSPGRRSHHVREIAHLFLGTDEPTPGESSPLEVRRFGVVSMVPGLAAPSIAGWMNTGAAGPADRSRGAWPAGIWTALAELSLEELTRIEELCRNHAELRDSLPGADGLLLVVEPVCMARRTAAYRVARWLDCLKPGIVEVIDTGVGRPGSNGIGGVGRDHRSLKSWASRLCREIPCRITRATGWQPPLVEAAAAPVLNHVRKRMLKF